MLCHTVWPDWAIYCTLDNFSKPVAIIILPKLQIFQAIFVKYSKYFIYLMKSFFGNFYSHLATFYWSHCCRSSPESIGTVVTYSHNVLQKIGPSLATWYTSRCTSSATAKVSLNFRRETTRRRSSKVGPTSNCKDGSFKFGSNEWLSKILSHQLCGECYKTFLGGIF